MHNQMLNNEVALVTGSTGGIGAATALELARCGARVVVTGRRTPDGEAVAQSICDEGLEATFIRADLTIEAEVAQLFEEARSRFGDVTVLVNNAAPTDLVGPSNLDGRLADVTTENFDHILHVGLYSAFWCCTHAIPMMQRAGHGSIINVSSVAGVKATPRVFAYATAKGGLQALTRSVAADYARDKIRANTVIVGFVISNPLAQKFADDPAMSKAMLATQLTRFAYPQDVASVIRFLATEDSAFMSGSEIYADGGGTVKHVIPATKAEARGQ